MEIDYSILQKGLLFKGISEKDIRVLFECISPKVKLIKKGNFVIKAGGDIRYVYYISSGRVHIIDEDFWGNGSIIETMNQNTLFGEAYYFSSIDTYLVSVVAAEDSVVLEISPQNLFEACPKGCHFHTCLVRNSLHIVSEKIVRLTEKLGHIVQRTMQEKVLSYLTTCAQKEKKTSFYIPYSRQQLADYLCVERSALSHELSRLQKQGMIRYRKNYFELLDVDLEEYIPTV